MLTPAPVIRSSPRYSRYYQSYLKFFTELVLSQGPGAVLEEFVLSKEANVVPAKGKDRPDTLNRYLGGFLHPLIHSGYGAEFGQLGMWAEGTFFLVLLGRAY